MTRKIEHDKVVAALLGKEVDDRPLDVVLRLIDERPHVVEAAYFRIAQNRGDAMRISERGRELR
jgi:hypothetical protein